MPDNATFDAVFGEIQPKNQPYLLDLVQQVNTYSGPPASPLEHMAGEPVSDQRVMLLPGSFLDFRYMSDVAQGIGESKRFVVSGLNYPGRIFGDTDAGRINQYSLASYVGAVYQALLEQQKEHPEMSMHLVGHSLGTIVMQMLLFISYYNQTHGMDGHSLRIKKVAILGGGPPRLGAQDYFLTFTTRLNTLGTVMQMANQPEKFISAQGNMWWTLGGKARYAEFLAKKMIYLESAALMKETFLNSDYAYLPKKLLEAMGVRALFVFSPQDLFVHQNSSKKAAEQWGAQPLSIQGGHSEMMFGETGRELGKQIARFF